MKKRVIITILLCAFLILGCTTNTPSKSNKVIDFPDKTDNFNFIMPDINQFLQSQNLSKLEMDTSCVYLTIDFDTSNSLKIWILDGDFSLDFSLNLPAKNKLPKSIDNQLVIDLINAISTHELVISKLDDFISAPDKKYLPADYKDFLFYGSIDDIVSYKSINFDNASPGNRLLLMVSKDLSADFSIEGSLIDEDLFVVANSLKEVLNNYSQLNWSYSYQEYYRSVNPSFSDINFSIVANSINNLEFLPSDFNFCLTFINKLNNEQTIRNQFSLSYFSSIVNMLAKEGIREKSIQEFLNNDSLKKDKVEPSSFYVINKRFQPTDSPDISFEYSLTRSNDEQLSYYFTN